MAWLLQSDFDSLTTIALWSIVLVAATTVVLFMYTMGLRVATITSDRRRRKFLSVWRDVFAAAAMNGESAATMTIPRLTHRDHTDLLEEWNRARSVLSGSAVENLIELARRVDIPILANTLFNRVRIPSRVLAAQTFGHLRDTERFDDLVDLLDHSNTALSITAAHSLVEIDAAAAMRHVVPRIQERRDWPKNKVSSFLREAGSELISEPMYRAIRSADNDGKTYLLNFARLIESETKDALVADLIRESQDPGVLTAALKLVSGLRGVPRIAALTRHEAWFVRMQAAKVLGRVGEREHLALLEALLDDPEWWVRYRAAQSIASLPFIGPNQLRAIRARQRDRYAHDILKQAMAEVGLA